MELKPLTRGYLILITLICAWLQPTYAADWPDCGFQCRAGDVTLQSCYLGDASGNPLPSCSGGSFVNAYLWISIYNNANSPRYAVILLADIYVNNVLKSSFYNQGLCVLDLVPAKATSSYPIYSFSWTCGQQVKMSRMILSWETQSGTNCASANRKCANRGTKCDGGSGIEVVAQVPLSVDFSSNSPQCCCGINFIDKSSGGSAPYSYDWNYGDGTTHGTVSNPTHIYAAPGNYTVTLTATDSIGNKATATNQVTLYANPLAKFTSNSPQCGIIAFQDITTLGTAPYSFDWDFGDMTAHSTMQNPTHIYANPGTYTVALNVMDRKGCTGKATGQVIINPKPLAKFSTNSPQCFPNQIAFQDSSSGGTPPYTYDWNLGDGTAHYALQSPNHAYSSPGSYNASLTIVDSRGCTSTALAQIVLNSRPKADAGPDLSIDPGGSTTIGGSNIASGGMPPYSYLWSPATGLDNPLAANPKASPTITTNYTLKVTDSRGCNGQDSMTVYITSLTLNKASSKSTAMAGDVITYTYTIKNTGQISVSGIALSDDRLGPISGLNKTVLAPGEIARAFANYTVQLFDLPGPLINKASATATDSLGRSTKVTSSAAVTLSSTKVYPLLECLKDNGDGTYTAFLGYRNDASSSSIIPVGGSNGFSPAPLDRGQPSTFLTGSQKYVFAVNFDGKDIIWRIGENLLTISSSSGRCPAQVCLIDGHNTSCANKTEIYLANSIEQPLFSYTYYWTLDGSSLGSGRSIQIEWGRYGEGYHNLQLNAIQSRDNFLVASAICNLSVEVIPQPPAFIHIQMVE